MNIILIGGPRSGSRSINLKCPRTRGLCASAAIVVLVAIVGVGFLAGRGLGTVEGLSASDVDTIFPNLSNFSTPNLGFV